MNKVVAVIPARKGSKRLPNKNKLLLNGLPLIIYSIESAVQCDFIDEIIISTDDEDIIQICKDYIINQSIKYIKDRIKIINRPEALTKDDTPLWEVVVDALRGYPRLTIVVLLQPTSPLRTPIDIKQTIHGFYMHKSCLSGYWDDDKTIKVNGAVYVNFLMEIEITHRFYGVNPVFYIMPKECSIDIDTLKDFKACEAYLQ